MNVIRKTLGRVDYSPLAKDESLETDSTTWSQRRRNPLVGYLRPAFEACMLVTILVLMYTLHNMYQRDEHTTSRGTMPFCQSSNHNLWAYSRNRYS